MLNKNKFIPTIIIILIIALSGGVSAFAERAIPGDLLYGVKVSINEPVAGMFALTKEEKVEWQERIIERRLEEAKELISKDGLNESVRIDLENKIKSKIDEFNANLNELALEKNESINSSDLNIRLQASLSAYQNVLEKLNGGATIGVSTKQETEKLLTNIEQYKNQVKDDHKNLELNTGVDTALNLLNSVKLLYQKEKINLSANIQDQIDSKLALAETALEEGRTLMSSTDYSGATSKFQLAISSANDAKLLMLSNVIKGNIENHVDTDEKDNDDVEFEGD